MTKDKSNLRLLDTNVLLRYLARDDEKKAAQSLALLQRLERGEEKAVISPLVVFEVVFTLQKRYHVPREQIRDSLRDILSLRGLQLVGKGLYVRALDIYATKSVSFADAYHMAYMLEEGIAEIYSFDADFDRVEGITRIEPVAGD
jgi:uncharacterized protein